MLVYLFLSVMCWSRTSPKKVFAAFKNNNRDIYINKVYLLILCSFCKKRQKVAISVDFFLKKACVLLIFFIPLHPLSGTKLF